MGEVWTKAFGLSPIGRRSHRSSWAGVEQAGDLWDMVLGFPQQLTPLPTPAASQHPSHASAVCLSHTQKQVHEHRLQAYG